MANIAYVFNLALATITPLWSVGVEEQFYLIWPIIIQKSKNYLLVFAGVIVSYLVFKLVIYIGYSTNSSAYKLIDATKIDIMAIGSIGAYLVFTKNKYLKLVYRKEIELVAWLILIISCIYKPVHIFSFIDAEVNSIIYLIIILNVSSNEKPIVSLENKFFNFLGKISYGIYIYHMFVIYLISYFITSNNIDVNYIIVFPSVLLFTIFLANLSYHFYETPFLKIKHKYTVIKSTNEKPINK
jgi:peptidoglycan/LPS O-acetylase OafA/YrhL